MGAPQKYIRIGIVEDHPLTRKGIVSVLEDHKDMKVRLQADSAEVLLYEIENKPIDILLLDLYLPGMNGDELLPVLAEKYPHLKTIMLSIENNPGIMLYVIQAGARAFLSKTCAIEEMVTTIRKVHECGSCIPDNVAMEAIKRLNSATQQAQSCGPFAGLSHDHLHCLQHVVDCLSVPETATLMHKSPDTIKGYRKILFKKTGCKNAKRLARYAIRHGMAPSIPVPVTNGSE